MVHSLRQRMNNPALGPPLSKGLKIFAPKKRTLHRGLALGKRVQGGTLLISGTVFALGFVFEHGEVGLVAGFGDVMVFEGFEDSTAGFVGMGAVGETAVFGETEDLLEITCQFFGLHVEGAEAFDARSIDEPAFGG